VRVGASLSEEFTIACGVPQGSPLSPLLFILYTASSLPEAVNPDDARRSDAAAAYADDHAIWATGARPACNVTARVQAAVRRYERWCQRWRLDVNVQKCEFVAFGNDRNIAVGRLTTGGLPIARAEEFKYLGVLLTKHLNWQGEVNHVKGPAISRINALHRSRLVSHPKLGLLFYKVMVRSVLEFPAAAICGAHPRFLDQLCALERRALRTVLGLPRDTTEAQLVAQMEQKFGTFEYLIDRISALASKYFLRALDTGSPVGDLVRRARENPRPGSSSPIRVFLDTILGEGPLPPVRPPPIRPPALLEGDW